MPKSHTFTSSNVVPSSLREGTSMMLSGLMSRWMIPWSCATESAAQTWTMTSTARSVGRRRSSSRRLWSVRPERYSITM